MVIVIPIHPDQNMECVDWAEARVIVFLSDILNDVVKCRF